MERETLISQVGDVSKIYDFLVIGGGATGIGIAVDAATRGYSVALFEQSDFTKGTSSRSTKLVHGGVRYLAQGDVSLAREALSERGLMRHNATGVFADEIKRLVSSSPAMAERLHPGYAYTVGEVTWIVRNEMPRTLEDVLARRLRILFLDARAAKAMAPRVAGILAAEWGKDTVWAASQVEAFDRIASHSILS